MSAAYLPPPRRSRRGLRVGLIILVSLVVGGLLFVLGVGLGQALDDNPPSGGTQTQIRTLDPVPLAPAPETVTVTVSTP